MKEGHTAPRNTVSIPTSHVTNPDLRELSWRNLTVADTTIAQLAPDPSPHARPGALLREGDVSGPNITFDLVAGSATGSTICGFTLYTNDEYRESSAIVRILLEREA